MVLFFILLVVAWVFIELSEVNFFPKKLKFGFTSLIITILIFVLVVGVFAASNQLGDSCQNQSLSCYIFGIVAKFPTWIGTFFGVFAGAFLAYELNMKKQNKDDEKAKYNKQVEDVYEVTDTLLKACISLENVYTKYKKQLDIVPSDSVARGMLIPYISAIKLEKIDVKLYKVFILDHSDENMSIINDLIADVHSFNNFVDLFEERNARSAVVQDKLSLYKAKKGVFSNTKLVALDTDFFEMYSKEDLRSYLSLTEGLLQKINVSLRLIKTYNKLDSSLHKHLDGIRESLGIDASSYTIALSFNDQSITGDFKLISNVDRKIEELIFSDAG